MTEPTMPLVTDPAVALAIGRCLAARSLDDDALTADHERSCGWCEYPMSALRQMVSAFNEWARFDVRSNTYGALEVRAFQALPRDEQRRLVAEAQDFPPIPEKPATRDPKEDPTWQL